MKHILKRISAVVLALTMMTSMLAVAHAEGTTGVFYFSEVSATPVEAGASTTFTVSLKNSETLAGFALVYTVTNSLGEDVTDRFTHSGSWLTAGSALRDDELEIRGTFNRTDPNLYWMTDNDYGYDVNGTILTMKLTPSTDLENGTYTITLGYFQGHPDNVCTALDGGRAANVTFEPFTFTLTGGTEPAETHNVTFETGEHATAAVTGYETADLANGITVEDGSNLSFTVTADEGYKVSSVTANEDPLTADDTGVYTYTVLADTTVRVVTAEIPTHTVSFTGAGATVTVDDAVVTKTTVSDGEDVSFKVTPNEGYELRSVSAEGTELTPVNGVYTLPGVTADTEVAVTATYMAGQTYTVSFSGLENAAVALTDGGSLNADNAVSVNWNGSVSFTVTPDDGYKISSVKVGTAALTAEDGVYTLPNVTSDTVVTVTASKLGSTTWDGTVADSFRSGTGTEADPYIIASADELAYLRDKINSISSSNPFPGAYFKLDADLDLSGISWTPIGQNPTSGAFNGTFDGNGHRISGLSVSGATSAGLFAYAANATIKDLVVSGSVSGTSYAGGLIGQAATSVTLINCGNEADVTATMHVGGLIGYMSQTTAEACVLTRCYNTGTITATGSTAANGVGGLAGYLKTGVVLTDCYNAGAIEATVHTKGGLVGFLYNGSKYPMSATNCFSVGTVNPDSGTKGALFGKIYSNTAKNAVVTNCYYLTSAYESDVSTASIPITEAELAGLAVKLGSEFNSTTAGTVTFTGDNVQVTADGVAVTSMEASSYPALAWEKITTRDSGGAAAFTVNAADGYEVDSVTADNGELTEGDAGACTLTGITRDATVTITAKEAEKASYTVTFRGDNATPALTDPALTLTEGAVTVTEGDSLSFTVEAAEGYEVVSVTAGGETLTADEAGVYTLASVAAETEVVITAQEKLVPAAGYTVSLTPSAAEVESEGTVTVDVVITPDEGKVFAAWDITLTYDPALFTYSTSTNYSGNTVNAAETAGALRLTATNDSDLSAETTIATLTFTANAVTADQAGSFALTTAKIAASGDSLEKDAVDAVLGASASVTVKAPAAPETYTVSFYQEDGTTLIGTISVLKETGTITETIPDAPVVANKEFTGWSAGTASYTAAQLQALLVTGDMSLTAAYKATEYAVTLDGVTGAATANYFAAYTGTISGYSSGYTYTVTVKDASDRTIYTVKSADIGSTGTFTIPAGTISGSVTMTAAKSLANVAVATYDYVAGQGEDGTPYTLIVVYGTAGGYTYDGTAMYRVAAYDNDEENTVTGGKAYAYIVSGTVKESAVMEDLDAAATTADSRIITASNDVNGTNVTDIADAQAVRDCYNAKNADRTALMATYLRADRNADHRVDMSDVAIVMDKITSK